MSHCPIIEWIKSGPTFKKCTIPTSLVTRFSPHSTRAICPVTEHNDHISRRTTAFSTATNCYLSTTYCYLWSLDIRMFCAASWHCCCMPLVQNTSQFLRGNFLCHVLDSSRNSGLDVHVLHTEWA